ncbi:MAG TPA: DUF222 domain-containing protein [Trebonia sp.]|nr:DUF222 domain-containing protein [Trebonia sp.]
MVLIERDEVAGGVMGWQPGTGGGAGASPDRDPGVPDPGVPSVRDPRLAWFASDAGGQDALIPSGLLALAADEVSGPGRRCRAASADELTGLLRGWAAVESWAAAGKLGVIAEMIRRDDQPRKDGGRHGDLPDEWSPSLRHEVALALACSVQSAQATAWLAWEVQARLRGIGALLHEGILTLAKARAVIETFQYLTDADAAAAEALILSQLPGKTYPQVLRLAEQAALTVDPELAGRRREQAQKRNARVTFFRELSGTAGLSGRDLPPDEALAAMAGVNDRAQQYEDSGAFGDLPTDALRAYAFTDLLKGTPAEERIACAEAQDEDADIAEALAWADARAARNAAQAQTGHPGEPGPEPASSAPVGPDSGRPGKPSGRNAPAADRDDGHDDDASGLGRDDPGDDGDHGTDPTSDRAGDTGGPGDRDSGGEPGDDGGGDDGDDGGAGDDEPGDGRGDGPGPGEPGPAPGVSPAGRAVRPRLPDLVVPLLTLLGLADRPGEVQSFGLLDPALARSMAAAAAADPRTEVCVTVTSPEGYAIGHGCGRPERLPRSARQPGASGASPARLNLTIPAEALTGLAGRAGGAGSAGSWSFAPRAGTGPPGGTGPPDGYGTWALTLPGGQRLAVRLETVLTESCDHRYESHGYHPSEKLRHLVQVRDGTCTFPSCNRHARESDFEHAIPFGKGGRTCTCNAGARSRACHRVKQTEGWAVSQPRPGWHQWTTPAGRVYTQGPKRYPA